MSSNTNSQQNPLQGKFTTARFGLFVITAGITAAGSLGLPEMSILDIFPTNILNMLDPSGQVISNSSIKILLTIIPGFVLSPLIVFFGLAGILGITLGHLVIATTSHIGSIDLYSPVFTFLGLFFIRQFKSSLNLIGPLLFVIITSLWIAFVGYNVTGESMIVITSLTFLSQLSIIIIGYILYLAVKQLNILK
jgi:hypothetical protein